MQKSVPIIMTAILVLGFIFDSSYAQEEMAVIDNSVFNNPVRPPATFQHDDHNVKACIEECMECHHVYEEGVLQEYESSEEQLCSECHELEASETTLPLMKAFHISCKGCHIEKKIGPIMCGECHKKENRA